MNGSWTMAWLGILGVLASLTTSTTGRTAEPNPTQESQFLSQIRPLTVEGRRSGEGYFSPDGKALIFQSEREPGNPFYQIYMLDLETGDSHRISPGTGKTTCAFFRPGTDEVLFASSHLDPAAADKQKAELEFRASGKQRRYSWDYDEHMDLFTARREGSGLRRLTASPGYDAEGAYSPDGSKIVFCSLRSAFPTNQLSKEDWKRWEADPAWFGEIWLMNADGSEPRRLTHTAGYDGGPFFSPDGRRIVWRRFAEDGITADIYTMNLDGSDVRRLTRFGSMAWAPYFHPSGQYVIFTSNKLGFGNFELFLVDADGSKEPVRVTFTDGFDGLPVFDPDGRRLCWTSNRTSDGQSQLFLAAWNHAATLEALARAPKAVEASGVGVTAFAGPTSATASATMPGAPTNAASSTPISVDLSPEINVKDLRSVVAELASDPYAGRMTGTEGSRRAAQFLVGELKAAGAQPVPGLSGDFLQQFTFRAGVKVLTNENHLELVTPTTSNAGERYQVERDFRPLSLSDNGEAEADVVFAGYGLSLPGGDGEKYDSYAGLDVSNKIVMVLRYVPEGVPPARRQELNRYAALRYKALLARERGARGLLVVTGPNSPNAGELIPMSADSSLAGSGILAFSIRSNVAHAILSGAGKDLGTLQSGLDQENPHAESGLALPSVRVRLKAALEQVRKGDRNVLACVPPAETAGSQSNTQTWILVGAHYDHLGRGEAGAMRRAGEEELIHPGADDNASGTAAVLELAGHLARERQRRPELFRRGVLFAFWSGEEIGLIGSSHFAERPPVPLTHVVAYVNFDMVGRLRDNKLVLQGIGSSPGWRRRIEKRNVAAGFNLALQDDPYLPTDVTALYPKGVPVLNFFTGSHEEYHRPTDRPETLDYPGLERITRFALGLILDLMADPEPVAYAKVSQSGPPGGNRDALRVYLGTIPDYAAEVTGVKLSGVRAGGPAEKAGLKGGDIIVELAGQKIANIYDYTYALDAVKIGQPTKTVVLRAGQRVELTVLPEARK